LIYFFISGSPLSYGIKAETRAARVCSSVEIKGVADSLFVPLNGAVLPENVKD
jgi:hypothetical protein